jgi:hypothetical protein
VSERKGEGEEYVGWLQEKSMLADASRIAGQFSGIADVWQSPFATQSHRGNGEVVGLVYRLSHLDDHQAWPVLFGDLGG